MNTRSLSRLLERVEALVERAEVLLPPVPPPTDLGAAPAFRWRPGRSGGRFHAVHRPHRISLADLHRVDRQKEALDRNTRQFVRGHPANNALLSGSRGTGKSSLVKALLNEYEAEGLRLVEVDKYDLISLPDILEPLERRPERFILFCDDLSFEAGEPGYTALKAVLDGSVSAAPDNVLLYATSNRRHLMPEYMRDNLDARYVGSEVHQSEAVEEKISLSERFGLWLSFHPFSQDDYLAAVRHWVAVLDGGASAVGAGAARADAAGADAAGADTAGAGAADTGAAGTEGAAAVRGGGLGGAADAGEGKGGRAEAGEAQWERVRAEALQWALHRGTRSGRSAYQFARDWAGRNALRLRENP